MEPSGDEYKFQLHVDEESGGFAIEGTIDQYGKTTILKKEQSFNTCPICLAGSTLIDTPNGPLAVKDLKRGMDVWTMDTSGNRVSTVIEDTTTVAVHPDHEMLHLVLDDGRELFSSPGHPMADGRVIGELSYGDVIDGAKVIIAEHVLYKETATYDILPSEGTGLYWANGILVKSTLVSELTSPK